MTSATLLPDEYDRLVKLLTVHCAYPLPYPLAGAYFEELFAASVNGKREPRKLLFDVLRDRTGWSLKTHQAKRTKGDTFEVVIQRCDILKNKNISLESPVEILGEHILNHFNSFFNTSIQRQEITDHRAAFLIRDSNQKYFIFFQEKYEIYKSHEISWRWSNDNNRSIMGFIDSKLVLRWYRSGTQLFGVYEIPQDAHEFQIDWKRVSLDETIAFFTRQGIARINKDS